ncbi:hypothetical protein KVR01_006312 [Diaporthe batatas]|uniref:uncharacterized protein n=1 Tax=Diaporthe batatas TaxID=748121 RepID=UPI001D038718|nr:uncharacterized protein KVR01_006312 [Diaporthe batatas]KAG8164394.1 hypothetical protein KVR01_006312 [Diaporthe batatas]
MSLPAPSSTNPPNDWEDDDMEYTTVSPPASIYRCSVDEILDQPHQAMFRRAITNVLRTKAAEFTLAQIIDGLPLKRIANLTVGGHYHKCVIEHTTLCPGALDRARELRDDFDPCTDLDLPVDVLKRYQNIPAGSRASKLPFIELVAVAIHRIAGLAHGQGKVHKLPVEEDRLCNDGSSEPYRNYYLTPFCLKEYANPEYPDGVADIVGYWAENWIFGGVVVFSRGESGAELINESPRFTKQKCNDVWLHSFREGATYRNEVRALTEDQLTRLLSFLESEPAGSSAQETAVENDCPLPIKLRFHYKLRRDADNCIPEHNIYRDRWERKMRFESRDDWDFSQRGNDVEGFCDPDDELSDLY